MKRGLLSIAMLLALPSFASAAFNCWSVTRGVMPAERAATLVAPADDAVLGYKTVGNITYVQAANGQLCASAPTTVTFKLTPPAGQAPVVKVDGLTQAVPTVGVENTYTVNKGTKITHTINATYAATATQVSITTIGATGGYISPSKKIAYNSDTTVTITPAPGFTVTGVKINGALNAAALTEIGADGGEVSLNDVTSATTVSAVFTQTPTLGVSIATANATLAPNQLLNLKGAAVVNMNTIVPTYAWTVSPAATLTGADTANATFTATATGTYTVTLTVSAAGLPDAVAFRTIKVEAPNVCASCHSVRDAALSTAYEASTHANNPYHIVSCADCHNPAGEANHPFALSLATSACAPCHAPYPPAEHGTVVDACVTCHSPHTLAPVAGSVAAYHTPGATNCAACHADHNGGTVLVKAQYVAQNVTCTDCHKGGQDAILVEYAESGHGDVAGDPWYHYDWASASRAACQRCHTTTGYVNNLTGSTTAMVAGQAAQVLTCAGCHTDTATGALRTAGAFTLTTGTNAQTVAFADAGSSNLCIRCHAGRETGASIVADPSTTGLRGFINSHYLDAAGVVYNKGGYEFAGQSYDNLGYHKSVGGAKGACVGCHMSAGEGHTWEFLSHDTNGNITANNSTECAKCHDGLTVADLNAGKAALHANLETLKGALEAKGIYFYPAHPYFFTAPYVAGYVETGACTTNQAVQNWNLGGTTPYKAQLKADGVTFDKCVVDTANQVAGTAGTWKDVMGAAFNYNLLDHDPGAYAHNRQYAQKLIADSLDYLNDGVVDGDSGLTVASSTETGHSAGLVNPALGGSFASATVAENTITATCGACHSTTNFVSSRHANQSARAAECSACHSHEGFVTRDALGKFTGTDQLVAAFNATAYPELFALPVAGTTFNGVTKKNCNTCHDNTDGNKLRGIGDETVVEGLVDGTASTVVRTKFSAEFNLCTACHMVKLDATWDTTEGYTEMGMFKYSLSADYAAENVIDGTTGTYNFSKLFYHDGASGTGRTFVDTHFGGTIASHLVNFDGSTGNVTLKGYNINPGNPDACVICHDPHTAGKMLAVAAGTTNAVDDNTNATISFASGLGDFHTDYLSDVFSRGSVAAQSSSCMPCHSGTVFAAKTEGAAAPTTNQKWAVVGCNSCHNLDKPNAVAAANDAAAFDDVRQFPAGYQFKFASTGSAAVAVEDLGDNAVCFECHKGRVAGVDVSLLPAGETQNYTISYLHYAPSMAILYGNDSKMVATYGGKSYSGRFQHPVPVNGKTNFSCTDCHNVHTGANVMASASCNGCHVDGTAMGSHELAARTQAFSERLLDTVLDAMLATPSATDAVLAAKLAELKAATTIEAQRDILMTYIEERQVKFPSVAIAHAAVTWKVFTYEDGPLHGQAHGHGGSWAHNGKFARQMMYDAIESLGGSVAGLTRPTL